SALISQKMASEMNLSVGSRLEILIPSSSENSSNAMRRDLYRVGGIFSAGLGEGERQIVLTDLRNVQRINGWSSDQISGYETWLSHDAAGRRSALSDAPYLSYAVNSALIYGDSFSDSKELESVAAFSVQGIYPSIFDWLVAHNVNAVVIITIMLIVAAFNIITALLIMVLERTQMIGLLKSLGMTNSAIRRIFLWRALGITARGMAWGNGVGLALCLLQHWFEVLKLDESGYMLSVVPIEIGFDWLLALNFGAVATILLMVTLPTKFATTIEPSKAIKYQ
ncbi:MAG: FtsX-like permease family protein, partial [Rikenellaceae bacterium]